MTPEVAQFSNRGMNQDISVSKATNEFAFENYNIRITAVNDNTLLSVTNEKLPKELSIVNKRVINYIPNKVTYKKLTSKEGNNFIEVSTNLSLYDDQYFVLAIHPINKDESKQDITITSSKPQAYEVITKGEYLVTLSANIAAPYIFYLNEIPQVPMEGNTSIKGKYVGHSIIDDKIIIFTSDQSYSYIYAIEIVEEEDENEINKFIVYDLLYVGKLNLSPEFPIETIPYIESDSVKKVYWTDGKNPLRVINIEADNLNKPSYLFDFNPKIENFPNITIEKDYNNLGLFPSGVIQYFVSYYNKFEQETGIIYSSSLHYITNAEGALSPEDTSNCSFKIKISNLDTNYEYVRVYSLIRTSENGTPICSIVKDVEISSNEIVLTDINNNTLIDSSLLLFLGGDDITASTMTQKDDVLFVGDIKTKSYTIDTNIINAIHTEAFEQGDPYTSQLVTFVKKELPDKQFNTSEEEFKTFKGGERYRFAIQFQDKALNWTEPIWIGDKDCDIYPTVENNKMYVASAKIGLTSDIISEIKDKYVNYRLLIAEPTYLDRKILAQGIVNPTVFNYEQRVNKTGPYAQASWILRPQKGSTVYSHLTDLGNYSYENDSQLAFANLYSAEIQNSIIQQPFNISKKENSGYILTFIVDSAEGAKYKIWPAYLEEGEPKIDKRLASKEVEGDSFNGGNATYIANYLIDRYTEYLKIEDVGISKSSLENYLFSTVFNSDPTYYDAESNIEGTEWKVGYRYINDRSHTEDTIYNYLTNPSVATGYIYIPSDDTRLQLNEDEYKSNFYVDSNVVTFHSPEIENIKSLVNDYTTTFKIVGIVPINSSRTDISIKTKTPGYSGTSNVNTIKPTVVVNTPTFKDNIWDHASDKLDTSDTAYYYTYLWQKDGSIIGQTQNSTDNKEVALNQVFAELQSKTYGYYRKSNFTKYQEFNNTFLEYDVIPKLFYSQDITTIKADTKNSNNYYQGNYDYINTTTSKEGYKVFWEDASGNVGYNIAQKQLSPVHIKYKTNPHLVFSLNRNGSRHILPDYYDASDQDSIVSYIANLSSFYDNKNIDAIKNATLQWTNDSIKNSYKQLSLDGAGFPYETSTGPYFYIGELVRNISNEEIYGGTEDYVLKNHTWIPASSAVKINRAISKTYGDTYYQRWNLIHALPFTEEDQNSVIDTLSFMVESHVNLEGNYSTVNPEENTLNVRGDNTNKINTVYSQSNNYFSYTILDDKLKQYEYPNQVAFSLKKVNNSEIDTWTNINLISAFNLNSLYGNLNKLVTVNDSIVAFQDKALSVINFNNRTAISTESGVPIEIANSGKVNGYSILSSNIGCQNKESICITSSGVYFIDDNNKTLYSFNKEGINDISSKGLSMWFRKHLTKQERVFYDPIHKDLYIVNNNKCLNYNEILQSFTSFYDYNVYKRLFNIKDSNILLKDNNTSTEISFSALFEGDYTNNYYVQYKINPEPLVDKTFTNIEYIADCFKVSDNIDSINTEKITSKPFSTLTVWNEYQQGKANLNKSKYPNAKNKFRIWRDDIPRDSANGRDRIRNPWIYLKLSNDNNLNNKMVFHNLLVKYYK